MLGGRRAPVRAPATLLFPMRKFPDEQHAAGPNLRQKKPAGEVADPLSCSKYRKTGRNVKSGSANCKAISHSLRRKYPLCR